MQAIDASENVDFNLHTHVECNSPLLPDPKTIVISTHVECDATTIAENARLKNFNSRTHVKCDTAQRPQQRIAPKFQLTHSRGVRRDEQFTLTTTAEFQLTHSRGVRQRVALCDYCTDTISTHALTWSATSQVIFRRQTHSFQLTHSRGVRLHYFAFPIQW